MSLSDLAPRTRSLPPLPTAVSLTVTGLVLLVFGATTPTWSRPPRRP